MSVVEEHGAFNANSIDPETNSVDAAFCGVWPGSALFANYPFCESPD